MAQERSTGVAGLLGSVPLARPPEDETPPGLHTCPGILASHRGASDHRGVSVIEATPIYPRSKVLVYGLLVYSGSGIAEKEPLGAGKEFLSEGSRQHRK